MMMNKYCAFKVNPSSYRQVAIGIGREHILPQYFMEDSTADEAAHHGGLIAHGHYGIAKGDLPYLSTDSVWQHRIIDREWHNITGVGRCRPPRPLRLLARDDPRPPPMSGRDTGTTTGSSTDSSPSSLAGLGGSATPQLLEEAIGCASDLLLAKVKHLLTDEILPAVIEKISVHKHHGATVAATATADESGGGVETTPGGPIQPSPSGNSSGSNLCSR